MVDVRLEPGRSLSEFGTDAGTKHGRSQKRSPARDFTRRGHSVDDEAVASSPKVTLLLTLLVTGACVALTVCYLGFKTDRADLIDPNANFQKRWLAYTENFGAGSDVVVAVEGEDPEIIRNTVDAIGTRLQRESRLFTNVLYRIEPTKLRTKGLQFIPPAQIEATLSRLQQFRPVAQGRWDLIELENVANRLAWQLEQAAQSTNHSAVTALLTQVDQLTNSLSSFTSNPRDFHSPWPEMMPAAREFESIAGQADLSVQRRPGPWRSSKSFRWPRPPVDSMARLRPSNVCEKSLRK